MYVHLAQTWCQFVVSKVSHKSLPVTKAKDNSAHMHAFQHSLPHTIPDVDFNLYHHCPNVNVLLIATCTLYIYSTSLLYNVVAKILENALGASINRAA